MSYRNNDNNLNLDDDHGDDSEEGEEQQLEDSNEFPDVSELSQPYIEGSEDDDDRSTSDTQHLISMDNVCGLAREKETLFNIFIYPAIFPQFFPGRIRWNQVLLYGPPGTGKTMLAKAMATEINATLHRITSADLLSHWQGQTEKQISELFREIRANSQPTVVFFDEIDGLCRRRTKVEDDSARRIKTELLTQLDDFASGSDNRRTFIIGATNCPWEIDPGFMRRFHKKIFIPLPDKEARLDILGKNFDQIETCLTEAEWGEVGDRTEGFSASDLVNVVMSSCCERFSQIKKSKYWEAKGGFWIPAQPGSLFSTKMNFEDIHPDQVGAQSVTFDDVKAAIENTPKTVSSEEVAKYLEFSKKNQIK